MTPPRALLIFDGAGRLCRCTPGAAALLPGLADGAPFPAGDPTLPGRVSLPDGRVIRWEPFALAGAEAGAALLLSLDPEPAPRAARAETLGEALATIVHRVNNRLTVILGGIDAADSALAPEHPARLPLRRAREAAARTADESRAAARFRHGHAAAPPADLGEALLRVAPLLAGDPPPLPVPVRVPLTPAALDAALLRAGLAAGAPPTAVTVAAGCATVHFGAATISLAALGPPPGPPLATPGAPIVLVEPDDDLREILSTCLRTLGPPVLAAPTAAAALAALDACGGAPAALIVTGAPAASLPLAARAARLIELHDGPAAPVTPGARTLVRPFSLRSLLALCRDPDGEAR